jgi:hypothetical protein
VTHFDVFNGDADGLCALHQLRLERPLDSALITGAKRDIRLLERVPAQAGDAVTALDVSLATNRAALDTLLARGVTVQYFDHHYAGELPAHPGLDAKIDAAPDVCTGIIVDRFLGGRRRIWAVVAAFGDDLEGPAEALAATLPLASGQLSALRGLGETLAYNAYGDTVEDLVVHPAELYRTIAPFADPFHLLQTEPLLARIAEVRRADLAQAHRLAPSYTLARAAVYVLPDAAWCRRARGALGNLVAQRNPDMAHAILAPDAEGGYSVSVRAPRARPSGADALCRGFASGGGRAAAAGINHLPSSQLQEFVARLGEAFR